MQNIILCIKIVIFLNFWNLADEGEKMLNFLSATGVAQYVIFALYLAVLIVVALVTAKKSKSLNDFMFASKGVGGWLSAFAYGATYFSAVIFIGYAGKFGWNFGLAAVWIGIGNMLIGTLAAWLVLAKRTKFMTNTLQARTMPEFFEKRYRSEHIKLLSSLLIFVFLLPYSSSVYQGLGYIFSKVIGLDTIWCILILAVVTAVYLFLGGYFATSITDFIQGIIMIIGILVCVFTLLSAEEVNWGEGLSALTQNGLGLIPSGAVPEGKSFMDSAAFNVIILVLLTSFGIWGLPQSVHKFYAIKDDDAIKKGAVISTVFSLIVGGGAYFVGSLVTLFVSNETFVNDLGGNFDRLVPEMLSANLTPALLGLILVLLFSASMSTLASLSLSSASTVSVDFYKGYLKKQAPESNVTILMRVLCLVFVAVSAILAIVEIDAIVTMMSLSWGLLAGCFIGPYVLGLYSKRINKAGSYASIISTILITIIMVITLGLHDAPDSSVGKVLKAGIGRSPFIGVVCMAASFIVTPVFSLIFKSCTPDKEFLATIFPEKFTALTETNASSPAETESIEK